MKNANRFNLGIIAATVFLLGIGFAATQLNKPNHTNALIREASPYLLQHAHNPVDWLPWGDAAFQLAKQLNKPIFLSIGYSACHWCHVMERESFENDSIAALLNENFIPIKVDREERPEVDHHYMEAVQAMTGGGGWPLSVFLTTDRIPFFGGTYWPPEARYGRPGFPEVLRSIADAWHTRQNEILTSAASLNDSLQKVVRFKISPDDLSEEMLVNALKSSSSRFDSVHGGFGKAPKFPSAMELCLLLRLSQRLGNDEAEEMALFSLRKMAQGGIYDHLGGGFHRYSTDERWLVPHFEKMLYDNALLAPDFLDAYVITGDSEFRRVAQETLDWVLREMEMPQGGFASSLDADADGKEGIFYVWTPEQVSDALGKTRGEKFCTAYDLTIGGNFEDGESILNTSEWSEKISKEFAEDRTKLLRARATRTRPQRDDKVLADWNGLMISALVRGFAVIGDERYLLSAQRAADRLLKPFEKEGRLVHSHLEDRTQNNQLLLDYASFGNGLLDLFLADGNSRWFDGCTAIVHQLDSLFATGAGPYRMSAENVGDTAAVDPYDSALPSGISLAGNLLARLFYLTDDQWYLERAEKQVKPIAGMIKNNPEAFSQALETVDLLRNPPTQLVLMGDHHRKFWNIAERFYSPTMIVIWREAQTIPQTLLPLLDGKNMLEGKATAYLCKNFSCDMPATTEIELKRLSKLQRRAN